MIYYFLTVQIIGDLFHRSDGMDFSGSAFHNQPWATSSGVVRVVAQNELATEQTTTLILPTDGKEM